MAAHTARAGILFDRQAFSIGQYEFQQFGTEPGDEILVPVHYGNSLPDGAYYRWQIAANWLFSVRASHAIEFLPGPRLITREPLWVDSPFGGMGLGTRNYEMSILPTDGSGAFGTRPVSSIGFDLFGAAPGDVVQVLGFGQRSLYSENVQFVYTEPTFIGLTAAMSGFDQIIVMAHRFGPDGNASPVPVAIDNITIARPIPEASSIATVSIGLFALVLLWQRKASRLAAYGAALRGCGSRQRKAQVR